MGVRLIQFLRGYVSLLLSGQFIERFFNICMHRGIFLWDICRRGQNSAQVKMSVRAFKMLPPIARKTRTRVKILEKRGLPIYLAACKRRTFFLVGLLLAAAFLYTSSLFLWSVDIVGCTQTEPKEIQAVLRDLGVHTGAYKKEIDVERVKNRALAKLDTLSWLWVDIRGCRATVRVQEKRMPPAILPTEACDIVAGADGIIAEIHATEGHKKVAAGDTVVRGQLLISAVMPSERIEARLTHAAGKVYARTWYEKSKVARLTEIKKNYTGNTYTRRKIKIGSFMLPLSPWGDAPYENFDRTKQSHDLVLFGIYTGISYQTEIDAEYTPETVDISREAAIKAAEADLDAQIEAALFDKAAERVDVRTTHIDNSDGTITVTRTAEFKEQIGVEKTVNVL